MTKTRAAACLLAAAWFGASPARADPASAPPDPSSWQFSAIEENDSSLLSTDKHYTQGMRLNLLSSPLAPGWRSDLFDFAGPLFPYSGGKERRFDWIALGQSIFTPENLKANPPDKKDRPYAGWLYTGAALLQQNGDGLADLELLAGMVGPAALGEQVQNDWHQMIGIGGGQGWHDQLKNEPGLALSYERRLRLEQPLGGGFAADIVPELGVTAGNVFTYGSGGALLRIGRHLGADYGPPRIRPAPSGTDWFDEKSFDGCSGFDCLGFYAFGGVEGRAVARNIFLDGNSFTSSAHVEKRPLVGDWTGGFSVFWKNTARYDFGLLSRTKEFYGQQGEDVYWGMRLAFHW